MLKITPASKHHPLHSRRRTIRLPLGTQRFLAAFEGIEGGFAIGSSIVVALSFTGLSRQLLLLTAVVSIIVSGFNSSSVKYSSEHYLDELDGREKQNAFKHYFMPAFIEFICYFTISFISVVPLIFIPERTKAIIISVIVTITLLFLAGFWRGFMLRTGKWRDGVETALLGLGIVAVGLISGLVVNSL
jgi:VIT1/CCC1 family predicted Fe2+/Mn2+ transporter